MSATRHAPSAAHDNLGKIPANDAVCVGKSLPSLLLENGLSTLSSATSHIAANADLSSINATSSDKVKVLKSRTWFDDWNQNSTSHGKVRMFSGKFL